MNNKHENAYILFAILIFLLISTATYYYFYNVRIQDKVEPLVNLMEEKSYESKRVIGKSTEKRNIMVHTYGTGTEELLIVGGIHGGYEWNSSLLAYELMDYYKSSKSTLSSNVKLSIIPDLNPDALMGVTGREGRFEKGDVKSGDLSEYRFNSKKVDLNRNFDCNWQATSTWKSRVVSAGSNAFSEPETHALRDYVLEYKPKAVIFLHSAAGAVYASECNEGILPATKDIMNTYSKASGYKAIESFDSYKITGDAEGWLASIGVPAITVELTSHESTELEKNKRGLEAVIKYFDKSK